MTAATDDKLFTIHAADNDFNACQRGDNPSAVFLHGFGGDLWLWDTLWAELNGTLSALRYDLRGFGRSGGDEVSFSHSEDLLAILDARKIPQCDLIGSSMGGAIALNFALEHPERVRKLVLISPGMVAWEWSEDWKALWRPIVQYARDGEMDKARELWWQHPLFDTARESGVGEVVYRSIQRYSGRQWIKDYQLEALPDVDRLYRLQPLTLLLSGGRDLDDFRLIADLIEASADNVTRVNYRDSGHMLQLEQAAACADRIRAFLAQ